MRAKCQTLLQCLSTLSGQLPLHQHLWHTKECIPLDRVQDQYPMHQYPVHLYPMHQYPMHLYPMHLYPTHLYFVHHYSTYREDNLGAALSHAQYAFMQIEQTLIVCASNLTSLSQSDSGY